MVDELVDKAEKEWQPWMCGVVDAVDRECRCMMGRAGNGSVGGFWWTAVTVNGGQGRVRWRGA